MESPRVQVARARFENSKEQLLRVVEGVPEERLAWTPSTTARTTVELVAHTAWAIGSIHLMYTGTPFPAPSMEAADIEFREWESKVTYEQALALLEKN